MSAPPDPGPSEADRENARPPLSQKDEDLIARAIGAQFDETEVTFPDGSTSQIEDALSQMVLHQNESPAVARQTFDARCTSDPLNAHGKYTEGVIKVDFQVLASMELMQYYQDRLNDCARSLKTDRTKDRESTRKNIKRVLHALNNCKVACKQPSDVTMSELFALRRFHDCESHYAPCLLDFVETTVKEPYHFAALKGGYMIFMLMPKLRGITLNFEYLRRLSREQRGELREKFKIALESIWHCGIRLTNCGFWNILWDEERKICSIISFRDCVKTRKGQEKTMVFTKDNYKEWKLNEELFKRGSSNSASSDSD